MVIKEVPNQKEKKRPKEELRLIQTVFTHTITLIVFQIHQQVAMMQKVHQRLLKKHQLQFQLQKKRRAKKERLKMQRKLKLQQQMQRLLLHSFKLVTGLMESLIHQRSSMDNYQNHAHSKIKPNAFTPTSHQLIQLNHHHLHAQKEKHKNKEPTHLRLNLKKTQPSLKLLLRTGLMVYQPSQRNLTNNSQNQLLSKITQDAFTPMILQCTQLNKIN